MRLHWMIAATLALSACSNSDSNNDGMNNQDYSLTYDAFDVASSTTLTYDFGGAFDFCPMEGDMYALSLDLETGSGTASVLRPSDGDDCVEEGIDGSCWVTEDVAFEVGAQELATLVQAIDEVPALGCTADFECDFCRVDTLTVGDTAQGTPCCFDGNVDAWTKEFGEVLDLLQSIVDAAQT